MTWWSWSCARIGWSGEWNTSWNQDYEWNTSWGQDWRTSSSSWTVQDEAERRTEDEQRWEEMVRRSESDKLWEEMKHELSRAIRDLEHDSFTHDSLSLWEADCLEEEVNSGKYKVTFFLPPVSPARRCLLTKGVYTSNLCECLSSACRQAGEQALRALRQQTLVDFSIVNSAEDMQLQASNLTWPMGGATGAWELGTRALCCWKNNEEVNLNIVEDTRYGLVTSALHQESCFNYHFVENDNIVKVRAEHLTWNIEMQKTTQAFHALVTGDTRPSDELDTVVVLFNVEGGKVALDVLGMEESLTKRKAPTSAPIALMDLSETISRLSTWEQLAATFAPSLPAPSPLKMHAICDGVFYRVVTTRSDTEYESLRFVGEGILNLLATLSIHLGHPTIAISQLRRYVNQLVGESRLAILMCSSTLLEYATKEVDGPQEAAGMLQALVGAHLVEGDFFSVIKLWSWLVGTDEFHASMKHLYSTAKRKGRTPTIEMLWEQPGEQEVTVLAVQYENNNIMCYRCVGCVAEERMSLSEDAEWQPLTYNSMRETFESQFMFEENGCRCQLPNKVCQWLRGAHLQALVNIKVKSKDFQPVAMCELCEHNNTLCVKFKEQGWIYYTRSSSGGLGFEAEPEDPTQRMQLSVRRMKPKSIVYSELRKTLCSSVIRGMHLPKIVAEWLIEDKCLAELAPASKCAFSADTVDTWNVGAVAYVCRVTCFEAGVIYEAGKVNDRTWSPLMYGVEQGCWTTTDQQIVPPQVIAWLAQKTRNEFRSAARSNGNNLPSLFPQSTSAVLEVEQNLKYTFKRKELLAEALTHGTAPPKIASVAACDRLAVVGEAAVRAFVAEWFWQHAIFASGATLRDKAFAVTTFAVPRGCAWPEVLATQEILCASVEEMERRIFVCCSHLAYSHTCVQLGMHQALHHNSADLLLSVETFASAVKSQASWEELLWWNPPKALGDIFVACIGAIILDSNYSNAAQVLADHINFCHTFIPETPAMVQEMRMRNAMEQFLTSASFAGCAVQSLALAPSISLENPGARYEAQAMTAETLNDVHVFNVDGKFACGSSPRTAQLRAQCSDKEFAQHFNAASSQDINNNQTEHVEPGRPAKGRVYCEVCCMWLNGPGQYDPEHVIGKKHKRNLKNSGTQANVKTANAKATKPT